MKYSGRFKSQVIIILLLFTTVMLLRMQYAVKKDILGISYSFTESQLMEKVNTIRREHGVSALSLNSKLAKAASQKTSDMLQKNYWAHIGPDGTTPWYFVTKNQYQYSYAGENLAKGYSNLDDLFNAWMESASHRDNILSSKYKDTGFAVVAGNYMGENSTLIVEIFASPSNIQL